MFLGLGLLSVRIPVFEYASEFGQQYEKESVGGSYDIKYRLSSDFIRKMREIPSRLIAWPSCYESSA